MPNQNTPESVSGVIVSKVAEADGVSPSELNPPLQTAVDVDALEAMYEGDKDRNVTVQFVYRGHQITVRGPEDVAVD